MAVELLVLVDNGVSCDTLHKEHGLSVLLQRDGRRMVFDAGESGSVVRHNAAQLGEELAGVEGAIVSHGHCDHTGGLDTMVAERPGLNIYAHPGAFSRRWSDHAGSSMRDISCPHALAKLCDRGAVFHAIRGPEMLADWLVLSGPIGGQAPPGPFVIRKGEEIIVDSFEDELFCLIRGDGGWVVLTGCCHRGLANTLRAARFLAHDEPIRAIVGGLHLHQADETELTGVVGLLERYGSPTLYPCHCTGERAVEFLARRLGEKVRPVQAGCRFSV